MKEWSRHATSSPFSNITAHVILHQFAYFDFLFSFVQCLTLWCLYSRRIVSSLNNYFFSIMYYIYSVHIAEKYLIFIFWLLKSLRHFVNYFIEFTIILSWTHQFSMLLKIKKNEIDLCFFFLSKSENNEFVNLFDAFLCYQKFKVNHAHYDHLHITSSESFF